MAERIVTQPLEAYLQKQPGRGADGIGDGGSDGDLLPQQQLPYPYDDYDESKRDPLLAQAAVSCGAATMPQQLMQQHLAGQQASPPPPPPTTTTSSSTAAAAINNNNESTTIAPSTPPASTSSTTIIEVRVKLSETRESAFFVPLAQLELRELEMKETARQFGVSTERWNGSRLHRVYHSEHDAQQRQEKETAAGDTAADAGQPQPASPVPVVIVRFDPASYFREHNLSHNFHWTLWLTDLLQTYYEEGKLVVPAASPEDSPEEDPTTTPPTVGGSGGSPFRRNSTQHRVRGDLILLALEYLGILYKPEQLVFGDTQAYREVKDWSLYLTVRAELADHVVAYMETTALTTDHINHLAGTASASEQQQHQQMTKQTAFCICHQDDDEAPPLPAGCPVLATPHLRASTVHLFFSQRSEMRHDFALYLQHLQHLRRRQRHQICPAGKLRVHFAQGNSNNNNSNDPAQRYWMLHLRRTVPSSSLSSRIHGGPRSTMNASSLSSPSAATSSGLPNLLSKDHKQSLPYPLDELVQEDLQRGTLEKLVLEAQERTDKAQAAAQTPPHPPRSPASPSSSSCLSGTSPRHVTDYPLHHPASSSDDKRQPKVGGDDDEDDVDAWQQLVHEADTPIKTKPPPVVPSSTANTEHPPSATVEQTKAAAPVQHDDEAPVNRGDPAEPTTITPSLKPTAAPPPLHPLPAVPSSSTPPRPPAPAPTTEPPAAAAAATSTATRPPRAATPPTVTSPSPVTVADDAAPIRVVRASSGNNSVTSALTGPFFYDQESEDELQAQYTLYSPAMSASPRRYREWISNSKQQQQRGGISARVHNLLDDATDLDEGTTSLTAPTFTENGGGRGGKGGVDDDPLMLSWNWINDVMCQYPRTLLQEGTGNQTTAAPPPLASGPSSSPNTNYDQQQQEEARQESPSLDDSDKVIEGATASNLLRNVEINASRFIATCGTDDDNEEGRRLEGESLVSRPKLQQPFRHIVVMEETPLSKTRTRSSRISTTTCAASVSTATPTNVKDRLQALQQKAANSRRRKQQQQRHQQQGDNILDDDDGGPEKEVVLSATALRTLCAADSSTSTTEEGSGTEHQPPESAPSRRSGGSSIGSSSNKKMNGVRFLFNRRKASTGQF